MASSAPEPDDAGGSLAWPDADLPRRFGGLDRLVGASAAQQVRRGHVVVVGVGGVGSWTAEALARTGVRRISLIDLDHVAESNINRQIHAIDHTIGQPKVDAMRDRIASFHPSCQVDAIDEFVTPENWEQLLPPGADVVVDACDEVRVKTALAAWAWRGGHALVTVGAAGGKRHAESVEVDDLAAVTHDPLLAQVRYRLRKFHGAARGGSRMRVACVFSREPVANPVRSCGVDERDGSLNCHGYGSLVTVTATFGLCAANWAINRLADREDGKNTL